MVQTMVLFQRLLTALKRASAPSSSADRFTRHSNESFDTTGSLSDVNCPRAVIISGDLYNSFWPSFDPVKPFESNQNYNQLQFVHFWIHLLRTFVMTIDLMCCGVSLVKNC